MARYTTTVRSICEVAAGLDESVGFDQIENVLADAAPKVFNFDFPIFDEAYRLPLEIKILRHFYMREICCETVGLWKLYLMNKMNEIMPFFNQMYLSELLDFNPLWDVNYTKQHIGDGSKKSDDTTTDANVENGTRSNTIADTVVRDRDENVTKNATDQTITNAIDAKTGNNTTNANSSGTDETVGTEWSLYSDTPQGGVDGVENASGLLAGNGYLTNATKNTEDTTVTSQSTNRNVTDTTENDTYHDQKDKTTRDVTDYAEDETTNRNKTENASHITRNDNSRTFDGLIKTTDQYLDTVQGKKSGHTYAQLLIEYRKTFLNIDAEILRELEPLFFGLWR